MTAAAGRAGLVGVDVAEFDADIGLDRAADLVDYRLGQAHVATWLAGQGDRGRDAVRAAAIAAVAPVMEPYRPRVVRLVARVRTVRGARTPGRALTPSRDRAQPRDHRDVEGV